jgi:predicted ABC-type ATPase
VPEFVNADVIAQGLSAFDPDAVAISAGRVMLARLKDLAARRATFAFETTLAGHKHAVWIRKLLSAGYDFHLVFLWLRDPELAVIRVRLRVELGGHGVPEGTVRRRYASGLRRFFRVYQPLATTWRLYDSSGVRPRLVASGGRGGRTRVRDHSTWKRIQEALAE